MSGSVWDAAAADPLGLVLFAVAALLATTAAAATAATPLTNPAGPVALGAMGVVPPAGFAVPGITSDIAFVRVCAESVSLAARNNPLYRRALLN